MTNKYMDPPKLYSVWNQMKQRCRNPRATGYEWYGARGIEVRWAGWQEFRGWALANGYLEGLTIDRIDNDGHYEAGNCRWITPLEQSRNKSDTVRFTAFGETKSVPEWVEDVRCVVSYAALIQRIRKSDWTPEEMVSRSPVPNQMALVTPGCRTECPSGHDLAVTRVWNKRGDYYCRTCSREKAKRRYREKVGST